MEKKEVKEFRGKGVQFHLRTRGKKRVLPGRLERGEEGKKTLHSPNRDFFRIPKKEKGKKRDRKAKEGKIEDTSHS